MSSELRPFLVCGTRPEAIKLAPLMRRLMNTPGVEPRLCSTGQHREMLDEVLSLFDLVPHRDLDIMRDAQDLVDVSAAVLCGLRDAIEDERPDLLIVQGDTNTAAAATLAAYYHKVPVLHVEAGLRTGDPLAPWPEEGNRRMIGALAARHYAPTQAACQNLLNEGISRTDIRITGNTVIDALLWVVSRLDAGTGLALPEEADLEIPDDGRRLALVTAHRRESFGEGLVQICRGLQRLSLREDLRIVFPVHPNPSVHRPVYRLLGNVPNIHLVKPLDYLTFVRLMHRCDLVITDSGGIQEEAPALGKPVLVTRETTEREEAVQSGTVQLVGADANRIVAAADALLDDPDRYAAMSRAINPYGTGDACERIVDDMIRTYVGDPVPVQEAPRQASVR